MVLFQCHPRMNEQTFLEKHPILHQMAPLFDKMVRAVKCVLEGRASCLAMCDILGPNLAICRLHLQSLHGLADLLALQEARCAVRNVSKLNDAQSILIPLWLIVMS